MFFPSAAGLNSTFVVLSEYWVFLATWSVFAGLSALEHPNLFVPGRQAGAPEFSYILSDHNMREALLRHYQWFHRLEITDVINAMHMNSVNYAQHGVLSEFFLYSYFITDYLESLVNRDLLIDNQSVSPVNLLLEVKHTISNYWTRTDEGDTYFWIFNPRIPGRVFRNLDEIGLFVDGMQDALFSINFLLGNLPEVEVLPPL